LDIEAIGPIPKANIFAKGDWTGQISLIRLGNFRFTRDAMGRRSCAKIARRANQFGDDDGLLRCFRPCAVGRACRTLKRDVHGGRFFLRRKMRRPIAF
jgi:hypothetical protein